MKSNVATKQINMVKSVFLLNVGMERGVFSMQRDDGQKEKRGKCDHRTINMIMSYWKETDLTRMRFSHHLTVRHDFLALGAEDTEDAEKPR